MKIWMNEIDPLPMLGAKVQPLAVVALTPKPEPLKHNPQILRMPDGKLSTFIPENEGAWLEPALFGFDLGKDEGTAVVLVSFVDDVKRMYEEVSRIPAFVKREWLYGDWN